MSTALDLDLATLVGELDDVPCESLGHRSARHTFAHDGGATHYARVLCEDCGLNVIKAYCGPFVRYVTLPNSSTECECGNLALASETITILGPVNGRSS